MPNSGLNETAEQTAAEIEIRPTAFADLPAIVALERRSFPSPWSTGMFVLEMSKPDNVSLTAVGAGRVAGYIVFDRFDRAWHLMNVAVAPERRRQGLATGLIKAGLAEVGETAPITLEVRPSNFSAIGLYESLGFRARGFRKGYYPDTGEDALIMWRGDPVEAGVPPSALGEPATGTLAPGGSPRGER